jgi:hypothetical protein
MTATAVTADTADTLRNVLLLEFALAGVQLSKARSKQSGKDTPGHRAAVAAARDSVDAVLDMYLAGRDHRSHNR